MKVLQETFELVRNYPANVTQLVRLNGRVFALRRQGERIDVRLLRAAA